MFIIGEVVIDEAIAHENFACDVGICQGACCTLPGSRGAPLGDDELVELERAFPIIEKYLPERHRKTIEHGGLTEGRPGSYTTACVDNEDCVFVYYENRIARCSLEKAYHNGEITWRKPLSCHLFPIRVSYNPNEILRYEKITECLPAVEQGCRMNIPLHEYLKEPLIRKFGESWYTDFQVVCRHRNGVIPR
jgi:hypothetical protein